MPQPEPPRIRPKSDKDNKFATPQTAAKAAHDNYALHGWRHEPYPCACGWWHVGTALGNRNPNIDQYRTGPGNYKPPGRRKTA